MAVFSLNIIDVSNPVDPSLVGSFMTISIG